MWMRKGSLENFRFVIARMGAKERSALAAARRFDESLWLDAAVICVPFASVRRERSGDAGCRPACRKALHSNLEGCSPGQFCSSRLSILAWDKEINQRGPGQRENSRVEKACMRANARP